mgnify:CR=1 FL=1
MQRNSVDRSAGQSETNTWANSRMRQEEVEHVHTFTLNARRLSGSRGKEVIQDAVDQSQIVSYLRTEE